MNLPTKLPRYFHQQATPTLGDIADGSLWWQPSLFDLQFWYNSRWNELYFAQSSSSSSSYSSGQLLHGEGFGDSHYNGVYRYAGTHQSSPYYTTGSGASLRYLYVNGDNGAYTLYPSLDDSQNDGDYELPFQSSDPVGQYIITNGIAPAGYINYGDFSSSSSSSTRSVSSSSSTAASLSSSSSTGISLSSDSSSSTAISLSSSSSASLSSGSSSSSTAVSLSSSSSSTGHIDQYIAYGFAASAFNGTYNWGGLYNATDFWTDGSHFLFYNPSNPDDVWSLGDALNNSPTYNRETSGGREGDYQFATGGFAGVISRRLHSSSSSSSSTARSVSSSSTSTQHQTSSSSSSSSTAVSLSSSSSTFVSLSSGSSSSSSTAVSLSSSNSSSSTAVSLSSSSSSTKVSLSSSSSVFKHTSSSSSSSTKASLSSASSSSTKGSLSSSSSTTSSSGGQLHFALDILRPTTGGYVTAPISTVWSTAPLTIEFWWRSPNVAVACHMLQTDDQYDPFGWYISQSSGVIYVLFNDGDIHASSTNGIVTGAVLASNAWYHIAVCADAGNGSLRLYVNGMPTGTSWTGTGSTGVSPFTNGGLTAVNQPLWFFDDNNSIANGGNFISGQENYLDEIRISSIVRYPTAFDPSTAKCWSVDGNTVGYWKCNEGSGYTVGDQTGNHNATWTGTPSWVAGIACEATSSSSSSEQKSSSSSSTKASLSSSSSSTKVSLSSSSSIAGDQLVQLGTSVTFTPHHSGTLLLVFNDNIYGDNSGGPFTVSVNGGAALYVTSMSGSYGSAPNTNDGVSAGSVTAWVPVTVTASGSINYNSADSASGPNGIGIVADAGFWAPGLQAYSLVGRVKR